MSPTGHRYRSILQNNAGRIRACQMPKSLSQPFVKNLGVSIDPTEIEHSRQLSDFSISVKLRMSGRDSAWHRTCQAMYRKPVRTGESVPSTYVTFDVTKSRNHILWCVRRLKKDSKSPICTLYTDHRGQISVKVRTDGPKIRLTYFTP